MNVVDSSAWLEYFANGSNASFFALTIERTEELLAPTGSSSNEMRATRSRRWL